MEMIELEEVLIVNNLKKHYKAKGNRKSQTVRALDGVSLEIPRGEIHAVVGETGSGKSTLGRLVTGLIEPTGGSVSIEGIDVFQSKGDTLRNLRKRVQIIFQDPYASLNPRFSVKKIIEEPLRLNRLPVKPEKIAEALRKVGLTPPDEYLNRYPHELSGGQRQRVSIARSLVIDPAFIVADEPVSMLDASMRASFLDLIDGIRSERNISMMLISHDISIAYYLSNRISVLYLGRIVEQGGREDVVRDPLHPYTRALIQSVPGLGWVEKKEVDIRGGVMSAGAPRSGCSFRERCPLAMEKCGTDEPELKDAGNGHLVACHLY